MVTLGVQSGMSKIGFRRILPLLFTAIHLVLTLFPHLKFSSAALPDRNPAYQHVAYQEGTTVLAEPMEPPPLKLAQKMAIVINLPAVVLATPVAMIASPRTDMTLVYATFLVPLLWYVVGIWLDGLLGFTQRLRLPPLVRRCFVVIAIAFLGLGIAIITPVNHHRTMDAYWIGSSVTFWSGLFLVITVSSHERRG